ncbi:MAG: GTPase [Ruminococcus sp.]|nr:GTPase [Ruminococcus sp.]
MPYDEEEYTIPVYLFLGFLESGKTKFIQETLDDKRFNTGERTLLLVFEEGEEEYNTTDFDKDNIFLRVVDDKSDMTPENLQRLVDECNAERIVIEYNGMWQVTELFDSAPDGWAFYQIMCFADATTFAQYNANMRSLVVDKLNVCELVVFNRFEKSYDPNKFHQIVRGVSRRCEIAYEYTDGTVAYDDIEDPLPFDVEAQHIVINDSDYALWYRDIMEEPEKYDGKTITFRALVARNPKFPKNTLAVGRHIMTCCVEDIQYCWCVGQFEDVADIKEKSWIMLTAKIKVQRHKLYRGKGPVLFITDYTPSAPPEKEVATFY